MRGKLACGKLNYDKRMLGHKQKLLGHVPGCARAWLRHCLLRTQELTKLQIMRGDVALLLVLTGKISAVRVLAPLSWLFTAMLRHEIVPDSLRDCILVPILKPGKDPSSSDSYHPIALAPTLSKVFELCLLFQFQSDFITSSLQFGFKPGFSADLCTGLLKNVIHNYLESDSHVYGCFLDASKAFDRVDHALLFEKLLHRHLLLSWYISQQLKVRCSNTFSEPFNISNGVRQGGVLSPILFTIYIDDLLTALECNGIGCF